jgi:hypothetical protein
LSARGEDLHLPLLLEERGGTAVPGKLHLGMIGQLVAV